MKKYSAIFAVFTGILLAGTSFAEYGEAPEQPPIKIPSQIITIKPASTPVYGFGLTFKVTQKGYENPYLFWVANKCSVNGILVSTRYMAVSWQNVPPRAGTSGPFTLSWLGGSAACTAYVYESPNSETPLASMTYSVRH